MGKIIENWETMIEHICQEDFLEKCKRIGVDSITDVGNDNEEGFKVIFKDKSAIYVLFKQEFGDSSMEYESEEHFNERWKNTKILSLEEMMEYDKKWLERMKDRYSDDGIQTFNELFKNPITK